MNRNLCAASEVPVDNSQLVAWTGEFGDEYVDRNSFAEWKMEPGVEAFRRMLAGLKFDSILEVGSNIGLNLHFINTLFEGKKKLYAVEPNQKAYAQLLSQNRVQLEKAWNTTAFSLPLPADSIDLVFTAGVLIHIAPENLGSALDEIVRVARRYVLCIEYFSHDPVAAPYRGNQGLLFKRDFGAFYLDRYPTMRCLKYGFLWQRELPIFDNLNWWLLEK